MGGFFGLFIIYKLRSKRQKTAARETSEILFSLLIWLRCNCEVNFEKTLSLVVCNGWPTYRVAYGVQKGILVAPTELEWVASALSDNYNPTLKDLFHGKSLKEGEGYYLLISGLDLGRHENIWAVGRSFIYHTYIGPSRDRDLW